MPLGIGHKNLDPHSGAGLFRELIHFPIAADANYFSSATQGGAQGTMSIATSVIGDALLLSTEAAKPLFYGRVPTITTVDASGTNLSITVRFVCRRFGHLFTQDITATGAGGGETVSGTRVVDEILSGKIVSISNNAASDT